MDDIRELQDHIDMSLELARAMRDDVEDRPDQLWRMNLVVTKLEEAELWLSKAW